MNVYHDFLAGMDADKWEFFALDFLNAFGYSIEKWPSRGPDGGMDGLVSLNGKRYLVSCKHYIVSNKAVGVSDEPSILDRMAQHGAEGFIGFYSTMLSSSLDERLIQLTNAGHECVAFTENSICNFIPKISSSVLQKYGSPKEIVYPLHVDEYQYRPLPCLHCATDILNPMKIRTSMGLISLDQSNRLKYQFGCKGCFTETNELGWVEINQALHTEQLNAWIEYVNDYLGIYQPSDDFYKNRSDFVEALQQRMFPPNWGNWLA